MDAYQTPYDIANRALQKLGSPFLETFADPSKQAAQAGFCYDKLRLAELERSVWRFATFRSTLRPLTATTKRMIPPAFSATSATYTVGQVVQDSSGIYWICQVANTSSSTNGPGSVQTGRPNNWTQYFGPVAGDVWSDAVTYSAGEIVYAVVDDADNWYLSLTNNNINNAVGTASDWAPLSATDLPITIFGPAGPGVTNQTLARNIYLLPNGYLRPAAPDPRIASGPTLSTSGGLKVLDWQFEGGYFVSKSTDPVVFRYVADISDVTVMDPLFCEGLAARLAYELCETLTQSQAKQQAMGAAYEKFIAEARNKNLLETGSTEEDDPDFLAAIGPAGVTDRSPAMNAARQQMAQ